MYEMMYGKKQLMYQHTTDYDRNGNEVCVTCHDDNTTSSKTKYTYVYDEHGNKTEQLQIVKDSIPGWKTTYTYDKQNRLLETRRYHTNGVMEQRVEYKYDAVGNNILQLSYGSGGKANGTTTLKYDEVGNLLENEDIYYMSEQDKIHHYTQYNSKGIPVLALDEYQSDKLLSSKSTFSKAALDKSGNWTQITKVTKNSRGLDTMIEKREITYY